MTGYFDRKFFIFITKFTITISLLIWVLSRCDINGIFKAIQIIPFSMFVTANIIHICTIFINSVKWSLLLRDNNLTSLFRLTMIGHFYSFILPGQLSGEATKAYIWGKGKKNAEQIGSSVILDKLTGIIGLLIVGITGFLLSQTPPPLPIFIFFFTTLIVVMSVLLCFKIVFPFKFILRLISYFSLKFPKSGDILLRVKNLIIAWHVYSQESKKILFSIALGIAYQLISIAMIILLADSLNINIAFQDWCWIITLLSIIVLLPLSLGGLGVREGSLVGLLGMFKVSKESAIALSFSILGLQIISALIGGFLEFKRTIKVKRLQQ